MKRILPVVFVLLFMTAVVLDAIADLATRVVERLRSLSQAVEEPIAAMLSSGLRPTRDHPGDLRRGDRGPAPLRRRRGRRSGASREEARDGRGAEASAAVPDGAGS